jgi:hypothetical protein
MIGLRNVLLCFTLRKVDGILQTMTNDGVRVFELIVKRGASITNLRQYPASD